MKRSKERDRDSEKAVQPDKSEVICPLIFSLVRLAVNYDLAWQPETKITVEDDEGFTTSEVTGVWKSNPVVRGHAGIFQSQLQKMRDAGEISWTESSYYFTHEEGIEARKAYEKEVLEGRLKAHITSWGPNPKKAHDKSRFHKFTGVMFETLKERYPELYSKPTPTPPPVAKTEISEVVEEKEEPTVGELKAIQTEEKVAAAVAIDELVPLVEDVREEDDHSVILCEIPKEIDTERIDARHESISWTSSDREQMQAYLVEVPEVGPGLEMWLPAGKWEINGQKYEVRVEE